MTPDYRALKERAVAISEDRSLEADWASRALADLLYEVIEAIEDTGSAS